MSLDHKELRKGSFPAKSGWETPPWHLMAGESHLHGRSEYLAAQVTCLHPKEKKKEVDFSSSSSFYNLFI